MELLFFKAPWCTACNAIEKLVPKDCIHINCNLDQETPAKYNIDHLPVFIAIDDNKKEIARIMTNNVKVIKAWYDTLKVAEQ